MTAIRECPKCGANLSGGREACPSCGYEIVVRSTGFDPCKLCGKKLAADGTHFQRLDRF